MKPNILPKVVFAQDYRSFEKDTVIEFPNRLTVISGDNGGGKSTLLSCIRVLFKSKWTLSHDHNAKGVLIDTIKQTQEVAYIDISKDLCATSPEIDFENINLHIQAVKSSSGQGSMLQLHALLTDCKCPLVILDEPERGLADCRQYMVRALLQKFMAENPETQVIITTHSKIFMDMADKLFEIQTRSLMSPSEYLARSKIMGKFYAEQIFPTQ
ncbi:AAA family ATPase [Vibrio owensii]|uniref:AAA family ATPase n=1 Tax=Vibrio harveyi group TaxID=717610 RepID=UPI003CC5C5C6